MLSAFCLLILLALGCGSEKPAGNDQAMTAEPTPAPAAPSGGGAAIPVDPPEKLVAELYKAHDANKGPFQQTKDRSAIDKYFTKTLADLIWKDRTQPADQIGALGADPLYYAQDLEIKNFNIGKAAVDGDKAVVPVTFVNFGQGQKIDLSLSLAENVWKISDIKYSEGSLLSILQEAYSKKKPNAPPIDNVSGEFEGTYRIGDTTCTVSPVKQGFEVRWSKGSGSEFYRFLVNTTFESEPDRTGRVNRFIFDDDNFDSGTFERADGKKMSIERAN